MLKTYSKLFANTVRSVTNWKTENRPIISFLEMFSKNELEEFLEKGYIEKYRLIKDIDTKELEYIIKNKNSNDKRLNELIMFFSISDIKKLATSLAESLRKNGLNGSTSKYLDTVSSMQQFISTLRNILNDRSSELKKDSGEYIFEFVLNEFNEKVGFDFNENDELPINYILSRYRTYNTLYNFEKNQTY